MNGPFTTTNRISLDEGYGPEALLHCPACSGQYLHHTGIISYDREEDAEVVRKTTVQPSGAESQVVANSPDNPSKRRHGIVIHFECEGCHAAPIELRIAQHKGATLLSWRYQRRPDHTD
jgi:hypothetical protein